MTHHVDDGAVRIGHEESADTPRFVGEGIHDVEPTRHRTRMNVVDISDFYAYLGKNRRRIIIPHQTHLSRRMARRYECHDEAHVHHDLQTQDLDVELSAGVEVLRLDVRHDPFHAHLATPFGHSATAASTLTSSSDDVTFYAAFPAKPVIDVRLFVGTARVIFIELEYVA